MVSGYTNLNERWFRKLITGTPHVVIGGDDDPYLLRWFLIPRNKYMNLYLHKFCRSDDDRALHDHPWPWWSFLLKGGYTEHTKEGAQKRKRFSLVHRPAEFAHRVELDGYWEERPYDYAHWLASTQLDGYKPPGVYAIDLSRYRVRREKPAWTLFITGKKQREWGFLCPKGWLHWEKFTEGGTPTDARNSLGCGELS